MSEMSVSLVSITPEAERTLAYCARVSNPKNQKNPNTSDLLRYCIKHEHWSIFEQANLVLEIQTSRCIAPQILRHRSFSFQEFSQRYAEASDCVTYRARRQDKSNRQNSFDDMDDETQAWFQKAQATIWASSFAFYTEALNRGIAKESARALLPLNNKTCLYMNGTIRSWIHYIQLRTQVETQLEHRQIAEACKGIFVEQLPQISTALGWVKGVHSS